MVCIIVNLFTFSRESIILFDCMGGSFAARGGWDTRPTTKQQPLMQDCWGVLSLLFFKQQQRLAIKRARNTVREYGYKYLPIASVDFANAVRNGGKQVAQITFNDDIINIVAAMLEEKTEFVQTYFTKPDFQNFVNVRVFQATVSRLTT